MDSAFDPVAWSDFGVAVAGGSAALAGLLFVAMSINVREILADSTLPPRAAASVVTLVTPLVYSVFLLAPTASDTVLGWELVGTGVVIGGMLAALVGPQRRSGHRTVAQWLIGTGAPAALLAVSTLLAGIGVLTTSIGGLNWLVVATLAAVFGGLAGAWVLLIEILR